MAKEIKSVVLHILDTEAPGTPDSAEADYRVADSTDPKMAKTDRYVYEGEIPQAVKDFYASIVSAIETAEEI